MVLTRRQRERSNSKTLSDSEHEEEEEVAVAPPSARKGKKTVEAKEPIDEEGEPSNDGFAGDMEEENQNKSSKEDADDEAEAAGGEAEPRSEETHLDSSDLFVLDTVGEEGNIQHEEEDQPDGYGISQKKKRNKRKKSLPSQSGNPLSNLLPGYTAPMQLRASSLDKFRPAGGIEALQRKAERTDASTRNFVKEATKQHSEIMQSKSDQFSTSQYTSAYASFKKGIKRAPDTTAGAGWFGMVPTPMTDELKADLAVIRNRNYLDPKKFYKSADKFGKVVQLGTVIEGAAEYYSARLTKKQRRSNVTEEIMADPASADYARNKFRAMQQEKTRESKQRKRSHRPKRGKKGF